MISALGRRRFGNFAPRAFIAGSPVSTTNEQLRDAFAAFGTHARVVPPELAEDRARFGDVVVGRLDVRPALDGVQPGLGRLRRLRDRGIRVVNDADALIATHDKLATALLLHAASIPQPRAAHLTDDAASPAFEPPYVVKPRFGSWGRDVHRCESRAELHACLLHLLRRPWFRRHGALVQELIAALWVRPAAGRLRRRRHRRRRARRRAGRVAHEHRPRRHAPKGRAVAGGSRPRDRSRRRGQRRPRRRRPPPRRGRLARDRDQRRRRLQRRVRARRSRRLRAGRRAVRSDRRPPGPRPACPRPSPLPVSAVSA